MTLQVIPTTLAKRIGFTRTTRAIALLDGLIQMTFPYCIKLSIPLTLILQVCAKFLFFNWLHCICCEGKTYILHLFIDRDFVECAVEFSSLAVWNLLESGASGTNVKRLSLSLVCTIQR